MHAQRSPNHYLSENARPAENQIKICPAVFFGKLKILSEEEKQQLERIEEEIERLSRHDNSNFRSLLVTSELIIVVHA